MNTGTSRADVRNGFAYSAEFQNDVGQLCVSTSSTSPSTKYVLSDLKGTTRAVMNSSGTVIARHDYLPFGEEIWSGTGTRTSSQGYGGTDAIRQKYGLTERDDATGLDHTPWRKLESFSGRWTSPDPYNGSMTIADPQSFNRYNYVQNDPVNFVDPSGLLLAIDYGSCHTVGYITINFDTKLQQTYEIQVCGTYSVGPFGGGGPGFGGGGGGGVQQKKGSGFVKPSKQDCAALAQEIERLTQRLEDRARDLRNDVRDFVGQGDQRQIQTHIKSFQDLQRPLQQALDKYDKFCKGGPPPAKRARELAGEPAPSRSRVPNTMPRSSLLPWLLPPVLVGLACLICPECCVAAAPLAPVLVP